MASAAAPLRCALACALLLAVGALDITANRLSEAVPASEVQFTLNGPGDEIDLAFPIHGVRESFRCTACRTCSRTGYTRTARTSSRACRWSRSVPMAWSARMRLRTTACFADRAATVRVCDAPVFLPLHVLLLLLRVHVQWLPQGGPVRKC